MSNRRPPSDLGLAQDDFNQTMITDFDDELEEINNQQFVNQEQKLMCEAFMEFLRDDCVPEKGQGRHGSTMSSRSRKQEIFKKLDNDKVKIWR